MPNAEISGPDNAPAILMLHGFMSSNLQWALNRPRLEKTFRLVMVELFGHGASPVPDDESAFLVDGYLARFEALRQSLGVDNWVVCGQSFGAGIVLHYARRFPGAVRGAAFTNSRSALSNVMVRRARRGLADWSKTDPRSLPFHPRHARRFPAKLKAQMEAAADAIPPVALWRATETTGPGLSCRDVVSQIEVPVLLVNGVWEKAFQADRDFAARAFTTIEIADLEGGHSINIENPGGFDAALERFAAKCLR